MVNGMRSAKCPAMAWAGGFFAFHERASPAIRAGVEEYSEVCLAFSRKVMTRI